MHSSHSLNVLIHLNYVSFFVCPGEITTMAFNKVLTGGDLTRDEGDS